MIAEANNVARFKAITILEVVDDPQPPLVTSTSVSHLLSTTVTHLGPLWLFSVNRQVVLL